MTQSFIIHDWMLNELQLTGTELLVFAVIYNVSQDGETSFKGSRQYLADTLNCSVRNIQTTLNKLVEKKLILKEEIFVSGNKFCQYTQNFTPSEKTALYQSNIINTNISNNTNINNIYNNKSANFALGSEKISPPKKKSLYDKCVDAIMDIIVNEELHQPLIEYLKFRLSVKDKQLYENQWRGMLQKLILMSTSTDIKLSIVNQSLEHGWLSFYELKSNNKFSRDGLAPVQQYTEEDAERDRILREERERNGQQTSF